MSVKAIVSTKTYLDVVISDPKTKKFSIVESNKAPSASAALERIWIALNGMKSGELHYDGQHESIRSEKRAIERLQETAADLEKMAKPANDNEREDIFMLGASIESVKPAANKPRMTAGEVQVFGRMESIKFAKCDKGDEKAARPDSIIQPMQRIPNTQALDEEIRVLCDEKVIPKNCIVYKNTCRVKPEVNTRATLANMKQLPEKERLELESRVEGSPLVAAQLKALHLS